MAWNCEQIEQRTSDYLDRLLTPHELREFAEHLEGCARCTKMVAGVTGLLAGMQRLEPVEPPPQLITRILDATIGPQPERRGIKSWRDWLAPVWQPRFAMGLVTVAITAAVLFQALGIQPAQLSWSDLHPANIYRAADRRVHLFYARSVKFVNDLRVVYEIQSRLQPEPEPGRPAEPEPAKQTPEQPGKQPRERNRADEPMRQPVILATALGGMPFRSMR